MPRGKKSAFGGVFPAVVLGVLVLGVYIPHEVWFGLGVLIVIAGVIYLRAKFTNGAAAPTASKVDSVALTVTHTDTKTGSAFSDGKRSNARNPLRFAVGSDPVAVTTSLATVTTSFRIPSAPSGFGEAKWVSFNESVTVADVTIASGLIYVGTSLMTPSGTNDPCLVDPSKSVASSADYSERLVGYWPSYAEIHSTARRAYLNWLAVGRSDPEADIGYVFMFFYGLERRAILDAAKVDAANGEWRQIAEELRRLIDVYGEKSTSFRCYACSLLDWVSLAEYPERAYLKPIPRFPKTFELPLYIRFALGQAAVDGAPVPTQLALAWARLDPTIQLRTPVIRCGEEFDCLFVHKYQEALGDGMILPRNRTKLKLVYRPASAGFRESAELCRSFRDTPDVTVLMNPIRKLQQIVEAATKELEPFSRFIGKNPDARHALESFLLLPAMLWPDNAKKSLLAIKARMGGGMLSVSFQELLSTLGAKTALTKEKTLALALALDSLNIGIEPDLLGGAKLPKADEKVVLFTLMPGDLTTRSAPTYQAAALTLQLASAVAAADGEFSAKEIGLLREQVQSWTHLTPGDVRRLLAHLRLLMMTPASLPTLKKKLEPLDAAARQTIAAFMATVAQSDGIVSPVEVTVLQKVYKALGIDSKTIFSGVHVTAADARSIKSAIGKTEEKRFWLDPARIAELQKDTDAVSVLLANIFKDEEQNAFANVETELESNPPPAGQLGLDEVHSALARLLLSRPEWTKDEISDAAADLNLMVDGAIEILNEAAFDVHDVAFIEGDDPLTINPVLLEKLQA